MKPIKLTLALKIVSLLFSVIHKSFFKDNSYKSQSLIRPNWAFAWQSSANLIALGFCSGLMRPAPGTWGTVFGWLVYCYCLVGLSPITQGIIILLSFLIGIWACDKAGKQLGVIDHSAWVWDEIVAIWLVLWILPTSNNGNTPFILQMIAVILFRIFDIIKPAPIAKWDKQFKNGLGVMWDDVVAAFYTLLCIAVYVRLFE